VSIRNTACSATAVRGADQHQGNAPAGQRGHIDRVVSHADARDHLQFARKRALLLAETREAENRAVNFPASAQEPLEIGGGDGGGKNHDFDVLACVEQLSAALPHRAGHQQTLSVCCHASL